MQARLSTYTAQKVNQVLTDFFIARSSGVLVLHGSLNLRTEWKRFIDYSVCADKALCVYQVFVSFVGCFFMMFYGHIAHISFLGWHTFLSGDCLYSSSVPPRGRDTTTVWYNNWTVLLLACVPLCDSMHVHSFWYRSHVMPRVQSGFPRLLAELHN